MKLIIFVIALVSTAPAISAQTDTSFVKTRALLYADSLLNAFRNNNWNAYLAMSYPGVVRYYGGKKGFEEAIQRTRVVNGSLTEEAAEKTEIIQILSDEKKEWQTVIKKIRDTRIDGKRAFVISYLVGQSKDEGRNWKYFDVAYSAVENLVYIMPDIFETLAIPKRQIVFQGDEVVNIQ